MKDFSLLIPQKVLVRDPRGFYYAIRYIKISPEKLLQAGWRTFHTALKDGLIHIENTIDVSERLLDKVPDDKAKKELENLKNETEKLKDDLKEYKENPSEKLKPVLLNRFISLKEKAEEINKKILKEYYHKITISDNKKRLAKEIFFDFENWKKEVENLKTENVVEIEIRKNKLLKDIEKLNEKIKSLFDIKIKFSDKFENTLNFDRRNYIINPFKVENSLEFLHLSLAVSILEKKKDFIEKYDKSGIVREIILLGSLPLTFLHLGKSIEDIDYSIFRKNFEGFLLTYLYDFNYAVMQAFKFLFTRKIYYRKETNQSVKQDISLLFPNLYFINPDEKIDEFAENLKNKLKKLDKEFMKSMFYFIKQITARRKKLRKFKIGNNEIIIDYNIRKNSQKSISERNKLKILFLYRSLEIIKDSSDIANLIYSVLKTEISKIFKYLI